MPKETFFNLPAEKRDAILAIAIDEFADHDYKSASISRIVRQAGIAKGSFYQYFDDKKDLYLHLVDLVTQEKMRVLGNNPPPDPDMGMFAYVRWLLRAGLDFEFSNPRLAEIAYRSMYGDAPLPAEVLAQIKGGVSGYFAQLVQQGVQQGVVDPALDPEVAAFVFNAVLLSLGDYVLQRLRIPPERLRDGDLEPLATPEAQRIFDEVMTVLERGLGPSVSRKP
ncbi:MAG: TetR/AcrR family transcriptional regulator [Anaerolineales bacterium]|nr:TetR/AcrR family transcriptional regulator [Anaerolineales bacterium]